MATTEKKRKGKKGSRKGDEPIIERTVADVPPELVPPTPAPETVIPKSDPVKVVRTVAAPKSAPVAVTVKLDPKAKKEVVGKVSINFWYGRQQVCLIAGKKTRIPVVALGHCRRLGYL